MKRLTAKERAELQQAVGENWAVSELRQARAACERVLDRARAKRTREKGGLPQ